MGIPNHDTIRTDHKVVTEMVDFVIHLSSIRELKIDFWVQGESHKAKPQGYDGAVIIWGVRDAPPASPDELEHHTMASRTPFTLHFSTKPSAAKPCTSALPGRTSAASWASTASIRLRLFRKGQRLKPPGAGGYGAALLIVNC